MIEVLIDLIRSHEIMIEEHIGAAFMASAEATLADARAMLEALQSSEAIVMYMRTDT
jgi:hypothetical protein